MGQRLLVNGIGILFTFVWIKIFAFLNYLLPVLTLNQRLAGIIVLLILFGVWFGVLSFSVSLSKRKKS